MSNRKIDGVVKAFATPTPQSFGSNLAVRDSPKRRADNMTAYNPHQLKPVLTSDGRPWVQRCFICDKSIDFLKNIPSFWVRVGELVRHRKCYPGMPK